MQKMIWRQKRLNTSNHTYSDHKNKAKHDWKLASNLESKQEFCDWTITCAFYYAVHCVEAYAHKKNKERELMPRGSWDDESQHLKRKKFVQKNLQDFFTMYCKLYDKSRCCRYDPKYFDAISKNKVYIKKLMECTQIFNKLL